MRGPTCSSSVRASKSEPRSSRRLRAARRTDSPVGISRVVDLAQRRAQVEVRAMLSSAMRHEPLEVGGGDRRRLGVLHRVDALREVRVDRARSRRAGRSGRGSAISHATRSLGVDRRLAQHDRHDFGDEAVGFGAPRLLVAFDEELPLDRAVGAREQRRGGRVPLRVMRMSNEPPLVERGDAAAVGREIDVAFAADAQRVVAVVDAEVHRAVAEIPAHRAVAHRGRDEEQRDADQDDVVHGG